MVEGAKPTRWVVQSPCSLGAILERMGQSRSAAQDGRVFVDRARCISLDTRLDAGSVVDVFPPPEGEHDDVRILSRRDDLVAVAKPAGLSTIPDQRGKAASLSDAVAHALGIPDASAVHATSRLDRLVSGVVVFALSRQAREAASQARAKGSYRRHYVALASQVPEPPRGWVDAPIGRGRRPTERRIGGKNAVAARSHYALVSESQGVAMVAVEPQTGRTHQIRVHLAHVGAPLVGDERYGASKRLVLASGTVLRPGRIALHAAWVEMRFEDGKPWRVDAPLPVDLRSIWTSVGGADDAWEPALAPLESEPPSTDASRRGRLAGGESR